MKISIIFFVWVLFLSCNKYVSNTIFNNTDREYYESKKVLVIGISSSRNTKIEREIEESMIRNLKNNGIDAVSFVDASEMISMAMINQDAVGFILEQNNVDYVLTVTNINRSLALAPVQPEIMTDLSYFRHVLSYQPDPALPAKKYDRNKVWESILFDVHRVEAALIIQTNPLSMKNKIKEINKITFHVANQISQAIQPGPPIRKGF